MAGAAEYDLWAVPYHPAPDGSSSNFDQRSDLLDLSISFISIMIFLMTSFMVLRLWVRHENKGTWRMDDWFAVATWVTTTALGGVLLPMTKRMGQHTWDVSLGFLLSAWPQRIIVASGFLAMFALFLGKCCVLALYLRIFGHLTHMRYQIFGSVVLALPILAASIVMPINSAPADGKSWGVPNPRNEDNTKVSMAVGIVNLIVDLVVLYIPIPVVVRMNLSWKRKFGVLAMFLTGLIALTADIVIMYFRVELFRNTDPLRHGIIVTLCAFIEAAISVIISCMPSTAKFWRSHIGSSAFYASLRSKLLSSRNKSLTHSSVPTHIRYPEPVQKKKPGLYSIPSLPTTNLSATYLSKGEEHMELSEYSDAWPVQKGPLESRDGSSERGFLTWNDPSNLIKNSSIV